MCLHQDFPLSKSASGLSLIGLIHPIIDLLDLKEAKKLPNAPFLRKSTDYHVKLLLDKNIGGWYLYF